MRGLLALVFALALAGCAGSPDYLGGRSSMDYRQEIATANAAGHPVVIAGTCYSPGCLLKLGAAHVEIAPDALISAHVAWPGYGETEQVSRALYQKTVPNCAREVLERPTFMTDRLYRHRGKEILAACPLMQSLGG